jgi:Protein of unknown function (DUF1553)/Protein of unknown function (DUF1549)/Bacterial Ig-like domain (group 2)
VTGRLADGSERDVTRAAKFQVADGAIAQVSPEGFVSPLKDGTTTLTIRAGGKTAPVSVTVKDAGKRAPVRFTTDIIPIFTKIGCNQGACHGAQAGQGGFKLSLRGYDPDLDYDQIVKQANGKRVNKEKPEESLLLKKPTAAVPHGGGRRIEKGSPPYETLRRWLKEGMAAPDEKLAVQQVTLYPAERLFSRPGEEQQLLVTARLSDGTTRDVTAMARYSSNDDAVATVDETGRVTAKGGGASAIMISYLGRVKISRVAVPVGPKPLDLSRLPRANYIDDQVYRKLEQLRIEPSGTAPDREFLRRAYLDVIATLPTPAEAAAFLADTDPRKREKLIDRLLARPEYVDDRALRLADLLRVNSQYLSDEGEDRYYRWIHDAVEANMPYDRFVRELLTGRGSNYHVGPANYYRVAEKPEELAETTAETFLGVRLQCAKCHNHPFENWTQSDYYSLAAFFARVGSKYGPEFGESQVVVRTSGDVKHPKTKAVMAPKYLGADTAPIPDGQDRRVALANWLTARDNLSFARVAVNRIWADYFGRGIVDPVDDFRISNPPANEELLDALARDFIAHGYDVKAITHTILSSRVYQQSSVATPTNARDLKHFARAYPRRLTAEEALDAVAAVTGKPDRFGIRPAGTRAIQLRDARPGSYFLEVFGRPKREILCACERDMQANLAQSLHLINSDNLNSKISADDGRIARLLKAGATDRNIIAELYLAALSRYPSPREMQATLQQLRDARSRREGLEDVLWALLNSEEFLFNH